MKRYEVVPGFGVGPVRLGMTRDEARTVMGEKPVSFYKAVTSVYETDAYEDNGFQIFYGGDVPRVEFIELSRDCDFVATYRDKDVFLSRADDIVKFIAQAAPCDETDPEHGYSYTFPDLELSLWRPFMPESENDPEGQTFMTIGIGIKGYFSHSQ